MPHCFRYVSQVPLLAGMFMVCVQLRDKESQLVDNSCRSTMLHYRSYLLHTLTTLIFSPMLMFGNKEEKQNIVLELFADFEEDQVIIIINYSLVLAQTNRFLFLLILFALLWLHM